MGGCLTSTREFKNQNEGSIQHHTMNAARRSTFWENAAVIEEVRKDTDSELNSTVQTWASMNLYEYSTTQNARMMTQSKMKSQAGNIKEVEPSDTVTEVQKDFDINSPIASETFSKTALENMFANTTTVTLEDPQTSFEMTPAQSLSDIAKVVSKTKEDSVPQPLPASQEVGSMEVAEEIAQTPVMYDASLQSYSAVDEFDEPAENKGGLEQSVDSFDKLLADPSVRSPDGNFVMVNTASGRWGLVSRDDILKKGRYSNQKVKYIGCEDEEQRRASSFEIRANRSFVL